MENKQCLFAIYVVKQTNIICVYTQICCRSGAYPYLLPNPDVATSSARAGKYVFHRPLERWKM
jgi:hypothetical protein